MLIVQSPGQPTGKTLVKTKAQAGWFCSNFCDFSNHMQYFLRLKDIPARSNRYDKT